MEAFTKLLSILAWPAVVLTALLLFRRSVGRVIDEITKRESATVGPKGLELGPPVTRQDQTNPVDPQSIATFSQDDPELSEYTSKLIDVFKEHLQSFGPEKGIAPDDHEARLLLAGADILSALEFERISRTIFGSQQKLLFMLEELDPDSHPGYLSEKFIEETLFELAQTAYPDVYPKHTDFKTWLSYPIRQKLIAVHPQDEAPKGYRITSKGKLYVAYFGRENMPTPPF